MHSFLWFVYVYVIKLKLDTFCFVIHWFLTQVFSRFFLMVGWVLVIQILLALKAYMFFKFLQLDLKFIYHLHNQILIRFFSWMSKMKVYSFSCYALLHTLKMQVSEAVVTGWLFFRYLVIGGSYNTTRAFHTLSLWIIWIFFSPLSTD